tara:strand:- start:1947 stop:2642 length:696 start_codon:yes stop_codon:yes gene_type:complete
MTQIYAHRGASKIFPENSLEAFEHAETLGSGWIELDVWLSKDGILTVHHDQKLETGEIITESDYSGFPENVPTLQDVLNSTKEIGINVEVKTQDNYALDSQTRRLIDELSQLLQSEGRSRDFLVSSFNSKCLSYFRDVSPATPVGILIWELREDWDLLLTEVINSDFQAIHPANSLVTRNLIAACKQKEIDINVWTVNDEDRMEELIDFGVDGIITDVPDVALGVVAGRDG